MTVVAWDGKTLAADRLVCAGNMRATTTKVVRHGEELIGFCGSLPIAAELRNWYLAGADPDMFPSNADGDESSELIVVKRDGQLHVYAGSYMPFEIEDDVCAFGAGGEAAMGALLFGATAEEAVAIASKVNITCGNGIDVLHLNEVLH